MGEACTFVGSAGSGDSSAITRCLSSQVVTPLENSRSPDSHDRRQQEARPSYRDRTARPEQNKLIFQLRNVTYSPESSGSGNAESMNREPAVLDTDTLSELSRGNPHVSERALAYMADFGRLTITAVTVFERLRGYRVAIRDGKPLERQMQAFEALVANCIVLPIDQEAARVAADIWSAAARRHRQQLGDILIASVAVSRQLPLVTRNKRDFERLSKASGIDLRLLDWSGIRRRSRR